MTENKRFKVIWECLDDSTEFSDDLTENTFGVSEVCDWLNELHEEKEYYQIKSGKCEEELLQLRRDNEQLKQAIAETEKMVQSTYDELTKLRCIKKNLRRIQSQWDWIMEAIQYD